MTVRSGILLHRVHVPDHDGERFLLAPVPLPHPWQRRERAAEMHAAPSLGDAYDPRLEHLGESRDRLTGDRFSLSVHQSELRAAGGAGDGLVVEPTCRRVGVLLLTVPAHREPVHGGEIAVVRQVPDDRETGAAVGAVGERIEMPPVLLIEHLLLAVVTDGGVVGNADPLLTAGASNDLETHVGKFLVRHPGSDLHGIQAGQWRKGETQFGNKAFRIPVHLDHHVGAIVLDISVRSQLGRYPVDCRPEPDPLDDAADGDTHRLIRTYGNYITYLQNVRRASGQSNILVTPIPREQGDQE